MENKKIYEYLTVNKWFGDLDKGTRLYYDFSRQGYVYHYENENTSFSIVLFSSNHRYEHKSFNIEDYFINLELADDSIRKELLIVGPELGELDFKYSKKLKE